MTAVPQFLSHPSALLRSLPSLPIAHLDGERQTQPVWAIPVCLNGTCTLPLQGLLCPPPWQINPLCSSLMAGASGPLVCRVYSKPPLPRMEPIALLLRVAQWVSSSISVQEFPQNICANATLCCPGSVGPCGHMWDAAAPLQKLTAGLSGYAGTLGRISTCATAW